MLWCVSPARGPASAGSSALAPISLLVARGRPELPAGSRPQDRAVAVGAPSALRIGIHANWVMGLSFPRDRGGAEPQRYPSIKRWLSPLSSRKTRVLHDGA